jgi:chromosome segregation ATPase
MNATRFWLACAAAAMLSLAAPLAAQAQDRDDDKDQTREQILTLGDGPAAGKQLTREQLRQCLQMQPQLKTRGDEATQARSELDALKKDFDRLDAELQRERAGLNAGDKAAVDAYNAKLARRKEMVAEYNAKQPTANEQAQRYNTLQEHWKTGCEDRPYSEADYASIPYRK